MQQHKILTWTLLILSIINFAPAAPVAVRERPEVRIDATVTRSVTAAPQKRGSWESPLPNVPPPPPSPDSTDILLQKPVAEQHMTDNPRRPPWSSTGPRLPLGLMPAVGSLLLPPESGSLNVPQAGPAHVPPQSQDSMHWTERVGPPPQWSQNFDPLPPSAPPEWPQRIGLPPGLPPSAPGPSQWSQKGGPPPPSAPPPSLDSTELSQRVRIFLSLPPPNPALGSTDLSQRVRILPGSHPLPQRVLPSLASPDSTDRSQRVPPNSKLPSRLGPSDQPTPLQSLGADPETHPLVNPAESLLGEFWDNLLKGKIKRRMSGSDAVTLEQEDPR